MADLTAGVVRLPTSTLLLLVLNIEGGRLDDLLTALRGLEDFIRRGGRRQTATFRTALKRVRLVNSLVLLRLLRLLESGGAGRFVDHHVSERL